MTYADEAVGVVEAAAAVDLPVVVSFTVETDGRLPSGQDARRRHPTRSTSDRRGARRTSWSTAPTPPTSRAVLDPTSRGWPGCRGVRANSSTMSHAELDVAEELDRGDVAGLAGHYGDLQRTLPRPARRRRMLRHRHEHVTAIAEALA